MNKPTRSQFLTRAVLASSIFVTPLITNATTFGPGTTPGPVLTSLQADNTVEVLGGAASGQIAGTGADGVDLNSAAGIVITRAQNTFFPDTITTDTKVALNITGAAGVVSIEFNSGVSATGLAGEAIQISAAGATITNAGEIVVSGAGLSAIEVKAGGSDATVNNLFSGVITNNLLATQSLILVNAGAPGFTLNNSGDIISFNPLFDTISLNSPFTSITNNFGGQITNAGVAATGDVIEISLGATAGDIFNAGTMSLTDPAATGSVVFINPGVSTSGNISNTGTMISQLGSTIKIAADMTSTLPNIFNSGTLLGTKLAAGTAVIFNAVAGDVLSGGIINTGSIIVGAGSISPNAIDLQTNPASITFFQDDGLIVGNVLLAGADSTGGGETFFMNGGTISGDVFAGLTQPNTLTLADGTIAGTVFLGPFGDTVDLSGTTVVSIIGGIGFDTVNITGGDITSLMDLGAGINTVNVGGPFPGEPGTVFTQNGIFQATGGLLDINVNGLGTVYTINNNIFDVGFFINNKGATTILNPLIVMAPGGGDFINFGTMIVNSGQNEEIDFSADIGGQFFNLGTLILNPNSTLTLDAPIAGTVALFFNEPGAFFDPQVGGLTVPGGTTAGSTLIVNDVALGSVLLDTGSFVAPSVSGFIPDGESFIVITVNPQVGGGTIIDNSTLIQPASATVFFTKALDADADDLIITAHRRAFSTFVEGDGDLGIAGLFDLFAFNPALITDQNLLNLLIQLDSISTGEGVDEALDSLAPDVSGAKYFSALLGMNSVFQGIFDRTPAFGKAFAFNNRAGGVAPRRYAQASQKSQFDTLTSTIRVADNGISFGDPAGAWAGWAQIYGGHLNSRLRSDSQGFKADGIGGVIGVDYGINDCFTLGIAGSYTKVDSDGKDTNPKDVDTKSWQATVYGLFELPCGMFMDAMVGWAHNRFETNRIINVGAISTAAQADFDGNLWGAQVDFGWRAIYCPDYYFAPFARLKYAHLHVDSYTETGADFLNLSVDSDSLKEWMGGLGFKLGTAICSDDVVWVPELTLMGGYDFNRDHEDVTAGFISITGTPTFDTVGARLGRGIFDLGLALHAHVGMNTMFTAKYDLEVRNHYTSNAGYLQFLVCY